MAIKAVQIIAETYDDYEEPDYAKWPSYMRKNMKQTYEAWHKMSQTDRRYYMETMHRLYGKGDDAAEDKLNDKYGLPHGTYDGHFR